MGSVPSPLGDLLASRGGEEMALNDRHLNPQLGRILRTLGFDRRWVGGEGPYLVDEQGDRYLDLLSGYGVFAVGRNHPEVMAALHDVIDARTANLPQLGVTLLSGLLAEELLGLAPASVEAMVPANSGAEAIEAAVKLARAATGRPRILYAEHAFHGLTLGALSLNGNEEFRSGFGPLLPGCDPIPFGDLDALERELAAGDAAAVVLEPVQGKGVNLPPEGYLAGVQERCRAAGTLFVCDEVQTGLGRTGRFFALEHSTAGAGPRLRREGALRRNGADRRHAGLPRRDGGGLRQHGARGPPRLHLRRQRPRRRGRAGHAAGYRAARVWWTGPSGSATLLLELTEPFAERYEIVREVRGLGLIWAIELGASGGADRSLGLGDRWSGRNRGSSPSSSPCRSSTSTGSSARWPGTG